MSLAKFMQETLQEIAKKKGSSSGEKEQSANAVSLTSRTCFSLFLSSFSRFLYFFLVYHPPIFRSWNLLKKHRRVNISQMNK
jgi:hypothetical protein